MNNHRGGIDMIVGMAVEGTKIALLVLILLELKKMNESK